MSWMLFDYYPRYLADFGSGIVSVLYLQLLYKILPPLGYLPKTNSFLLSRRTEEILSWLAKEVYLGVR